MSRLTLTSLRAPVAVAAVLAAASVAVIAGGGLPSRASSPRAVVAAPTAVPTHTVPVQASRSRTVPAVAALRRLLSPDLLLTTSKPLTSAQAARIRAVRGVTATTVIDSGVVRVGRRAVNAMGVDASTFRAFTPRFTIDWTVARTSQTFSSMTASSSSGSPPKRMGSPK